VKPGVQLLSETGGSGDPVRRHAWYDVRLRFWLHRGDAVRWDRPWGLLTRARLEDDGSTLFTTLRVDREQMFAGLFYGVDGMRVGGTRLLRVAPHLGYGEKGVPGIIPPSALLDVEVTFLYERTRDF
jgi:hypothetical protein